MRVSVLTACMYEHCMHARGGQKRALELPRLELQTIVIHHVGSGD